MGLLLRRSRSKALLAAIFLIVLGYFAASTLFNLGDDVIQSSEDMDLIAAANGGKMKLLPAENVHFRKSLEIDIDHQPGVKEQFQDQWEGHRENQRRKQIFLDRNVNYYDEDEEGNLEDETDAEEEVRLVPKKETFKGDFHRILEENKEAFVALRPKAQVSTLSGKFLSYDMHEVQHCITHHTLGHLPVNIHSDAFSIPQLVDAHPESAKSRKTSFGKVFLERAWGHGWDKGYDRLEASGRGSTLSWAQEFIATLHSLVNDLKISLRKSRIRMLDLPCGDMAWMSRFLVTRDDIDYTGVDIVPELIANHRKAYRSQPWHFRLVDIIEHPLEERFDIIVSRMMLQHLFYADGFRILKQFSESNSTALLMTTFMRTQVNSELSVVDNPGRLRKLNLGIPPLSLVPPLCVVRDGPPDTFEGWDHFVGVWQLPLRRLPGCNHSNAMVLKGTDKTVYDCVNWEDT